MWEKDIKERRNNHKILLYMSCNIHWCTEVMIDDMTVTQISIINFFIYACVVSAMQD